MQNPLAPKVPALTLFVILLSVAVQAVPEAAPLLIFDRGVIAEGEVWRLLTGHLVHFSHVHLAYNVVAFGISGWIMESTSRRLFGFLCFILALLIGTLLFIFEPGMGRYGGLSGLACGAIVYLSLQGLRAPRPWNRFCLAVLILSVAKIAMEVFWKGTLLPYGETRNFVPVPLSHLVGSAAAAAVFLCFNTKHHGGGGNLEG